MHGAGVCFWEGSKDTGSKDRAGGQEEGHTGSHKSMATEDMDANIE